MKTNHTSGPCHVATMPQSSQTAVRSAAGGLVCAMENGYQGQRDIDARLIAAAPDLLNALYIALPFVEDAIGDECYKTASVKKALDTITEVIAKARGQP